MELVLSIKPQAPSYLTQANLLEKEVLFDIQEE